MDTIINSTTTTGSTYPLTQNTGGLSVVGSAAALLGFVVADGLRGPAPPAAQHLPDPMWD
jgi:hypothetical protein